MHVLVIMLNLSKNNITRWKHGLSLLHAIYLLLQKQVFPLLNQGTQFMPEQYHLLTSGYHLVPNILTHKI